MKNQTELLRERFFRIAREQGAGNLVTEQIWNEISKNYSSPSRHYHTLRHIGNIFNITDRFRLDDKSAVEFAVWFHDIIYDTTKSDNEEISADYAEKSLKLLSASPDLTEKVKRMILLTKHNKGEKITHDEKIFLDADLSILGSDGETYREYKQAIRNEFIKYPDAVYNAGRKKVLQNFLSKQYIYQTDEIRKELEFQAIINITEELKNLNI
jgi:predicted metal-dependent HD superfamily phosphohydrolase